MVDGKLSDLEPPQPTRIRHNLGFATKDSLAFTKAFMQIKDAKLRRNIVNLVEEIAGYAPSFPPPPSQAMPSSAN